MILPRNTLAMDKLSPSESFPSLQDTKVSSSDDPMEHHTLLSKSFDDPTDDDAIISNMDVLLLRTSSESGHTLMERTIISVDEPEQLPECRLFNFATHPLARLSSWSINTWYQRVPSCIISVFTKLFMFHTLHNPYVWTPEESYGSKARYDFQLVQVKGLEHLSIESLEVLSPTQVEVHII